MAPDVRIDLISDRKLRSLTAVEKVTLILDAVTAGRVVVLEHGLDPFEEAQLIADTMARVGDLFTGIEIQSYTHERQRSVMSRLLGTRRGRLTIIGPADRMKTLRSDKDHITALITLSA